VFDNVEDSLVDELSQATLFGVDVTDFLDNALTRSPVITTCAPSSTKRLAVAKPIPLLPPVMTAIFPANFCPLLLLICFVVSFCSSLFFENVRFTLFLQS